MIITQMPNAVRMLIATLLAIVLSANANAESQLYFVHTDHLGTPQVVTDKNQNVVWKGEYTPFGEVKEVVNTLSQNVRFPGQYFDVETGLHYNYFRDYDPNLGRYVQSDPIGLSGGLNTYAYVGGNPISYIDPDGKAAMALPLAPAIPAVLVGCYLTGTCQQIADACGNLVNSYLSEGTRSLDDLEPIHDPDHPQNDPGIKDLTDQELIDSLLNPSNGDKVTVKGNTVYDGNTRVNEAKSRGLGDIVIPVDELPNPDIDSDQNPLGAF